MSKKTLFISGTDKISGAEFVFKDYAINSKYYNEITMLSSDIPIVKDFYNSFLTKTITYKGLNPVNATASKFAVKAKIKKVINILKSSYYINKLVTSNNYENIIANNTRDIVYSLKLNNKKNKFYLFVHDMITPQSSNGLIIKLFNRKVDKFIVVSNAVKNSLVNLGIAEERIILQYNGLNYSQHIKSQMNEKIKIGFVGALIERKSPLTFLELIKNSDFKGYMAFNYYDEEIFSTLKKEIKNKKLNVELLGNLSRKQVNTLLQEMDYLCVPSLEDPLPTVILESFNNGTPVIGRAIDGIPEMIIDNTTGYLFNKDSELRDICKKIGSLTHDEYKYMSENANNRVKECFNIENKIKVLDQLFFN